MVMQERGLTVSFKQGTWQRSAMTAILLIWYSSASSNRENIGCCRQDRPDYGGRCLQQRFSRVNERSGNCNCNCFSRRSTSSDHWLPISTLFEEGRKRAIGEYWQMMVCMSARPARAHTAEKIITLDVAASKSRTSASIGKLWYAWRHMRIQRSTLASPLLTLEVAATGATPLVLPILTGHWYGIFISPRVGPDIDQVTIDGIPPWEV
jgi:hypothetical protein